jgi:hypothetical protein
MRRAVIHIGTPRTGTTSLQTVLCAYREDLAAAGVLYPDLTPRSASSAPHLSHQYLGEALDGRRPRREQTELLDRLDEVLAGTDAEIVMLSYEGFCLLPPRHRAPDMLLKLFARRGFAMEIALTVKAQELYAESQYTWRCQLLREGRVFADALPRILRHRRFNYDACLRAWARAAGGRVHAIPVHDRRSSAPLIERILTQLGLMDRLGPVMAAADLVRCENRSPGPAAIEVSRRLRHESGISVSNADARIITDAIAEEVLARGLDTLPFHGLDSDISERVISRFAVSNDRFAQSVWGESWSRRIAAVPLAPANAIVPGRLDCSTAGHIEAIATAVRGRFGIVVRAGRSRPGRDRFESSRPIGR